MSNKGNYELNKKLRKAVIAFLDDGEVLFEFNGIREAVRELEKLNIIVDRSAISKVCRKVRKHHGIYNGKKIRWRFKE